MRKEELVSKDVHNQNMDIAFSTVENQKLQGQEPENVTLWDMLDSDQRRKELEEKSLQPQGIAKTQEPGLPETVGAIAQEKLLQQLEIDEAKEPTIQKG